MYEVVDVSTTLRVMPTPYNTRPLRALMTDDEAVTGYQDRAAAAVAKMQADSLDPISNSLELQHHVGGLGQILASSWAIQAMRAWQEIRVAMAVDLGTPRTAIAEAMGLATGNNFRRQFPQLEQIVASIQQETNSGQQFTLTVRGFHFTLGPMWRSDDTDEPDQDRND